MTKEELRSERKKRDMNQREFGEYMASLLGGERPYTPSEISVYETGQRPVPTRFELALMKERAKSDG